ncbi:4-aminobutyrate aminotransferase, partial [Frankliniella fusca]
MLSISYRCYSTEVSEPARTDESFRALRDPEHHNYISPLTRLPTQFISQFPYCAMHLIDLGIFRRYLFFIKEDGKGPLNARMTAGQTALLRDLLQTCSNFIPVEFTRKPSLRRLKKWRASELKMFLLYLGPVLLCFVVKEVIFKLYLLLNTSIYIMHSENLLRLHLPVAKESLQLFVQYSAQLLGPGFVTYNVHSALHLHEDVERHGKLSSFSGYPFEDMLGQLKRIVRSPNRPLEQVYRRLSEKENAGQNEGRRRLGLVGEHREGPLPLNVEFNAQFAQYNHELYTLKISVPNNCVGLADGKFGLVVNILSSLHNDVLIVVKVFQRTADIYDFPIPSSTIGCSVVGGVDEHLVVYRISDVLFKCFMLPMDGDNTFGAIPLVHMINKRVGLVHNLGLDGQFHTSTSQGNATKKLKIIRSTPLAAVPQSTITAQPVARNIFDVVKQSGTLSAANLKLLNTASCPVTAASSSIVKTVVPSSSTPSKLLYKNCQLPANVKLVSLPAGSFLPRLPIQQEKSSCQDTEPPEKADSKESDFGFPDDSLGVDAEVDDNS